MMIQRHKLKVDKHSRVTTEAFHSKYRGNLNGNFNDMFDYRAIEFSNRVKDFFFSKNKGTLKEIFNHLKEEMFLQRVKPVIMDLCFWTWVTAKDVYREAGKIQRHPKIIRGRSRMSMREETDEDMEDDAGSKKSGSDRAFISISPDNQGRSPNGHDTDHFKWPTADILSPENKEGRQSSQLSHKPIHFQIPKSIKKQKSYIKQSYTNANAAKQAKRKKHSNRQRKSRSQVKISLEKSETQRIMEADQSRLNSDQKQVYKMNHPIIKIKSPDQNHTQSKYRRDLQTNMENQSLNRVKPNNTHKDPRNGRVITKWNHSSSESENSSNTRAKKVKFLSKNNFETEVAHSTESGIDPNFKIKSTNAIYSQKVPGNSRMSHHKGAKKVVTFEMPLEMCQLDKVEGVIGKMALRGLELCGDYLSGDLKKMHKDLMVILLFY